MSMRRSRTYRMQLSQAGMELFLSCHFRLARLTSSLLPYGTTLFVAILLADTLDTSEIKAEMTAPSVNRLKGNSQHFVGTSKVLAQISAAIIDRMKGAEIMPYRTKIAHLYVASLAIMAASEDDALATAYRRMKALLNEKF